MKLHVESRGNGPDLVLLHGWAMHSGIWGEAGEQLARHFRLHLVDLPGHGYSAACGGGTLQHMVEMIAEVLPEAGAVCGWSLGGQVAIQLALREPARVRRLALISTTPCFIKREAWQSGADAATLQLFMANLKKNYKATMSRFLTLQVWDGERSRHNDNAIVLARLRENFFRRGIPDEAGLQACLQILLANDLRGELSSISQPALLLHGENDVITPLEAARWMHRQMPHSRLTVLPHCGHAPFLSHPREFISAVTRFLSRP
jgi:pimeloyl-[acyl-carrier protein] methyl ester esterase